MSNVKEELEAILSGIDKEDQDGGWWETTQGAEHGLSVKIKLTNLFEAKDKEIEALKYSFMTDLQSVDDLVRNHHFSALGAMDQLFAKMKKYNIKVD